MSSFSISRKKTPFQKHREEEEAKKKRAEDETARLYAEFVESFQGDHAPGSKTFVRGGTINPNEKLKSDAEGEKSKDGVSVPKKGSRYVPSFIPPPMASKGKEPERKREEERPKEKEKGKTRNIDHFMEELKHEHEMRERRNQDREQWREGRQTESSAPSSRFDELPDDFDPSGKLPGSFDDGDPQTTNLYVGNLSPQVDENFLLRTFGRFGPIASVKIMWPRTEEERRRQRNCGFVAFMNRADGQAAKDEMQGVIVYEYELKIGWGKSVALPSQALPAPPPGQMAIRSKEGATVILSGPSGPPVTSVPNQNSELVLTPNVPDIMVIPPKDDHLRHVIDTMALYVLDGGCAFEQAIMQRGRGNPLFNFLFELGSKEHSYYVWRLYSFAQGDTLQRWRTEPFIMIIGSGRWVPPSLPTAKSPEHEKESGSTYAAGRSRRVDPERTLTDPQRDSPSCSISGASFIRYHVVFIPANQIQPLDSEIPFCSSFLTSYSCSNFVLLCLYALFFTRFFMAAALQSLQNHGTTDHDVSRKELQDAIAKAVELRALHAALMQGNSPANLRFPSSSPVSRSVPYFSVQDYPVFTPSYEDEPLPEHHQILTKARALSESWNEFCLEGGSGYGTVSSYYKENSSSRKGIPSDMSNLESPICPAEDKKSVASLSANNTTEYQPETESYKSSRMNSLADFKSISSCNRGKPATITTESEKMTRNSKHSNIVVPMTDSHSSLQSQPKNRGVMSWLFPKLKKKQKNDDSSNRTESEVVSQTFKDMGIWSIETLKRELMKANEHRDSALTEVAEMKSSLGNLRHKLEQLESYCKELKKALRQATQAKNSQVVGKLGNLPNRGKSIDGNGENLMPLSEEVMVEGFFQIVSEARLSVRQFCKTLAGQIEETDSTLMDSLNLLLQPYKLSLNSKYSKAVLYHFEAIVNQSLYQDFENCVFQKNGSPKNLDPNQDRQAQFSSFVALRNLSWNEVIRKGTKHYNEEFSKFCDQKMSCIITTTNWTRPWPEKLLQPFFVAAKCIWLLHLLAFSFNPPLGILRVEENRNFDPHFMEDMLMDRQRSQGPSRVKIMVMPGFYVQDRVLRSMVLCRYKSVPKLI